MPICVYTIYICIYSIAYSSACIMGLDCQINKRLKLYNFCIEAESGFMLLVGHSSRQLLSASVRFYVCAEMCEDRDKTVFQLTSGWKKIIICTGSLLCCFLPTLVFRKCAIQDSSGRIYQVVLVIYINNKESVSDIYDSWRKRGHVFGFVVLGCWWCWQWLSGWLATTLKKSCTQTRLFGI